ncbi:MAG TPA: sugar phosphate isomerase/epimerase family protein [Cyclobacteriaceae bacterium]|nr:sugar phosphate isomerase/epimerase family protein [Cyclobacteriaceae bacterium]
MTNYFKRRTFVKSMIGLPALMGFANGEIPNALAQPGAKRLKTSLNFFSLNEPLTKGTMTLDEALDFSAGAGFEGIDITGYYFKGYPSIPSDDYLFHIKRKAFNLGLEISGTGVRNDFTVADTNKRQLEVDLVKRWVEVAAKLGAPVIRIFSGTQKDERFTKQQVTDWMVEDIQTCVDFGKQHGVVIGLQNHNDFLQTAEEINGIIESIHSEWLGIILDTGSYRVHDPYDEIARSVKHAVNWQIKEKVFINGAEVDTDMKRLVDIINASGYQGYLPIETLGPGDPKDKIITLLEKLKEAIKLTNK